MSITTRLSRIATAAMLVVAMVYSELARSQDWGIWRTTAANYVGPGDVAPYFAWYSCTYGYSAAYAAPGTNNACTLTHVNSGATCTAKIGASGLIDLTIGKPCNSNTQTVTAWAGSNATCTGTIAATVMTISGCASGAISLFDSVTGAGITANTYITSDGTGLGLAGTYNLSQSSTVGVAETITITPSLLGVLAVTDQTGGGRNFTFSTFPNFTLNCFNILPCMGFGDGDVSAQITISAQNQPMTWTIVGERTGYFTFFQTPLGTFGSGTDVLLGWNNAVNSGRLYAGSQITFTIADSVWHSVIGVINGASSVVNMDGTETTGSTGAGTTSTGLVLGNIPGRTNAFDAGNLGEVGFTTSAMTPTQRTATCDSAYKRYGLGTPC